jgi:hypothetical protein
VLFLQQAVTPYKLARPVLGEVKGIGHFLKQGAGRRDAVGGKKSVHSRPAPTPSAGRDFLSFSVSPSFLAGTVSIPVIVASIITPPRRINS